MTVVLFSATDVAVAALGHRSALGWTFVTVTATAFVAVSAPSETCTVTL